MHDHASHRLLKTVFHAVFGAIIAAALAGWASAVLGGAALPPRTDDGSSAPLVERVVALKCVHIVRRQGRNVLVNTCPVCRSVQVKHARPGGAAPSLRAFTLAETSRFVLPFRGPGQSRVWTDIPCRGAATAVQKPAETPKPAAQTDGRQCVRALRTDRGMLLVNVCEMCRAVIVARTEADGRRRHRTYAITGRAYISLPSEGAVRAELATEGTCG